jgi:hypothetical protein
VTDETSADAVPAAGCGAAVDRRRAAPSGDKETALKELQAAQAAD